ncbi:MAG: hydroxymethylbilane synthase [Candidatus Paracaedibacteraceae bacterium]|nr:hydroxymethylbilane synthase [Candidatus Paracaedibacteraceae bacterium]
MGCLRLGTRGSPLALRQAEIAKRQLAAAGVERMETVIIHTTGDKIVDKPLWDIGGKGLFAKELQQALLEEKIDIAVHSLKDMEWHFPAGLQLTAVLEREDPRDCFVSLKHSHYHDLPPNSVIGTCSPRRVSQLHHRLPTVLTIPLRGNVQTRLHRLEEMGLDGIILAVAGLKRLELTHRITMYLEPEFMIPSAGQGVIALESRIKDGQTNEILRRINHKPTWDCITAEKAVLAQINGDCHTPIGVYAQRSDDGILFMRSVLEYEGQVRFASGEGSDPYELATQVVRSLLT